MYDIELLLQGCVLLTGFRDHKTLIKIQSRSFIIVANTPTESTRTCRCVPWTCKHSFSFWAKSLTSHLELKRSCQSGVYCSHVCTCFNCWSISLHLGLFLFFYFYSQLANVASSCWCKCSTLCSTHKAQTSWTSRTVLLFDLSRSIRLATKAHPNTLVAVSKEHKTGVVRWNRRPLGWTLTHPVCFQALVGNAATEKYLGL